MKNIKQADYNLVNEGTDEEKMIVSVLYFDGSIDSFNDDDQRYHQVQQQLENQQLGITEG